MTTTVFPDVRSARPTGRRLLTLCAYAVFTSGVLFAGCAKMFAPETAAEAWSALLGTASVPTVRALGVAEVIIVLTTGALRSPRAAGSLVLGLATLLVAARTLALALFGVEDCGCMGRFEIPPAMLWVILGSGVVAGAALLADGAPPPRRSQRPRQAVLATSLAASLLIVGTTAQEAPEAPWRRLAAEVAQLDPPTPFIMVGSYSCAHCRAAWQKAMLSRSTDEMLLVVTHDDVLTEAWPPVRTLQVDDDWWWQLLDNGAPPAFATFGQDGLHRAPDRE